MHIFLQQSEEIASVQEQLREDQNGGCGRNDHVSPYLYLLNLHPKVPKNSCSDYILYFCNITGMNAFVSSVIHPTSIINFVTNSDTPYIITPTSFLQQLLQLELLVWRLSPVV